MYGFKMALCQHPGLALPPKRIYGRLIHHFVDLVGSFDSSLCCFGRPTFSCFSHPLSRRKTPICGFRWSFCGFADLGKFWGGCESRSSSPSRWRMRVFYLCCISFLKQEVIVLGAGLLIELCIINKKNVHSRITLYSPCSSQQCIIKYISI